MFAPIAPFPQAAARNGRARVPGSASRVPEAVVGLADQALASERRGRLRQLRSLLSGRIVHDLRRSGVRHLIHAGVDPHTVTAFSGHRTPSMPKRYHIIALDDLRTAPRRAMPTV